MWYIHIQYSSLNGNFQNDEKTVAITRILQLLMTRTCKSIESKMLF